MSIGGRHQALRATVLARDAHECQVRGPGCTGRATVAGHIIARRDGGANTLDNYRAECLHCSSVGGGRLADHRPPPPRRHPWFDQATP